MREFESALIWLDCSDAVVFAGGVVKQRILESNDQHAFRWVIVP
jgi:hypothetical protein